PFTAVAVSIAHAQGPPPVGVLVGYKLKSERANLLSNSSFQQKNALLVDADEAFGQVLQPLLGHGYLLLQESSATAATATFDSETLDAVLLNLDTPDYQENSRLLLQAATNRDVPLPVIAYSWEAGGQKVLEAFKEGAFETLSQPLDGQQFRFALDRACRRVALARELVEARKLLGVGRVEVLLGH